MPWCAAAGRAAGVERGWRHALEKNGRRRRENRELPHRPESVDPGRGPGKGRTTIGPTPGETYRRPGDLSPPGPPLLVTQRFDRIEPCRPPRRPDAEEHADAAAQFDRIEGTNLEYTVNAAAEVVLADGRYYACDQGVWYVADSPDGPRSMSETRPIGVDDIPPSCPQGYHVPAEASCFISSATGTARNPTPWNGTGLPPNRTPQGLQLPGARCIALSRHHFVGSARNQCRTPFETVQFNRSCTSPSRHSIAG